MSDTFTHSDVETCPAFSIKHLSLITLPLALLITTNVFGHGAASAPATQGNPEIQTQADARKIVFPDTETHKTLVVDLHTHTVFSDGHVWPKIRVGEALRDGLDAMAVTEHLEYQPHIADIPHADRNRAYAETLAAAEGSDLMVIAGSEITRSEPAGHINAVFINDANALFEITTPPEDPADVRALFEASDAWPAQNAVDAAAKQGAFMFWNHPYWTAQSPDGIARMNDFHQGNIEAGKLHGIEVANGRDYSAEAHAIALEHSLTLIGVSDVHDLIDWDYAPHNGGHRPVNLVLATDRTPEALRSALFAGRTLVWFKNLLIAREPEMTAMLDASLEVTAASYRPNTQVLDVSIHNHSDARFDLHNLTDMTFMDHANHISIAPHATTTFSVKPGEAATNVALTFEVRNALLTPTSHPSITFNVTPEVEQLSEIKYLRHISRSPSGLLRHLCIAVAGLLMSLAGCGTEQPVDRNSGALTLVSGTLPPTEQDVTDHNYWQADGLSAHEVPSADSRLLVLELDPAFFEPAIVAAPQTGIAAIDALRANDYKVVIGSGFVSELNSLAPVGLLQINGETLNPVQGYGYTRILGINDSGMGVVHRNDYQRALFHSALQAGPGIVENAQLDISEKDLLRPKYFRSFIGLCAQRWLVGVSLAPTHLRTLGQAMVDYADKQNWQCEDLVNLAGDRQAVLLLRTSSDTLLYHGDPDTYKVSLLGFR